MATVELHALRRLSSSWTFFYKRVFPTAWLGSVAVFLATARPLQGFDPFFVFVILASGTGIVFGLFKYRIWNNVDEVWDAGDALLVRNRGEEELVPLAGIRELRWSQWQNPETVTLLLDLRTASRFGDSVTFLLPMRWVKFGRHPLVTELQTRIAQAQASPHF